MKSQDEDSHMIMPTPPTDHPLHNSAAIMMDDMQENADDPLVCTTPGRLRHQQSGGSEDKHIGQVPANYSKRGLETTSRFLRPTAPETALSSMATSSSTHNTSISNKGGGLHDAVVDGRERIHSAHAPTMHRGLTRTKSGNLREAVIWRSEPSVLSNSPTMTKNSLVDDRQEMSKHRASSYQKSDGTSFSSKDIKPRVSFKTVGPGSGLKRRPTGFSRRNFDRSRDGKYTFASSSKPGPDATEAKLDLIAVEYTIRPDPLPYVAINPRQEKKNKKATKEQHTNLATKVGNSAFVKSLLKKEPSQDALSALKKGKVGKQNINPSDSDAALKKHLPRGHIPKDAVTPTSKFTAKELQEMKDRDKKRKKAEKAQTDKLRDSFGNLVEYNEGITIAPHMTSQVREGLFVPGADTSKDAQGKYKFHQINFCQIRL